MKKFQAWKIRRELYRIYYQIKGKIWTPSADRMMWKIQDLFHRSPAKSVTAGDLSYGSKVAIFLIFQPKGVAGSVWFTLEHLLQQGWSPVVVSNAPVSSDDLARLRRTSVKVIERENVGYDFGGYRDGVLQLKADGIEPERVLVLNDSSWFPLRASDDTLQRLEALDADFSGHVYKSEDETALWRDHIESHLLMFNRKGWTSDVIQSFWADYVMTSNKDATIDRGERGLSQAAIKAGLKVEAIWDRDKAVQWLNSLSDAELLWTLHNLVIHTERYQAEVDSMIARFEAGDVQGCREEFKGWTFNNLSNSRQLIASSCFMIPGHRAGLINFMKKTSDMRYHFTRYDFLAALDAGEIEPIHPVVEAEIRDRFESWKPEVSWRTPPDGMVDLPRRYQHLS